MTVDCDGLEVIDFRETVMPTLSKSNKTTRAMMIKFIKLYDAGEEVEHFL